MGTKVAVLGGGNTGCVMSAEFTLRGFDVTLYEEKKYWHEHIDGILANGGVVTLTGNDVTGDAHISRITDDLSSAIEDADVIFVSLVSWRHEEIGSKLKGVLKSGQTVIFSAGNFASIRMRQIWGMDAPVVVGEMMGNIFPSRMVDDRTALIGMKLAPKMVAAFPASDTEKLIQAVSPVLPCTAGRNVFEAALNSPNVVIHLAGSLTNLCNAERDEHFKMYLDGLSPSVLNCMKAVEEEKRAVMDRMGYKMVIHTSFIEQLMEYDKYPQFELFRNLEGPTSRLHRYINEDARCGDCLLLDLGKRLGVQMPTLEALMTLASVINDFDYASEGITLDKLGVVGKTPEEINTYLELGK